MKNLAIFFALIGFLACKQLPSVEQVQILKGETMGTYYQVSYVGDTRDGLQEKIDSLLRAVNQEVSTYEPNSVISRFNQSINGIKLENCPHFKTNLEIARAVYERTQGAFDATVMPLVNFWGFGYTHERLRSAVDTAQIADILQWVGLDQVQLSGDSLLKDQPEVQLDFSACAKGYGVDAVAGLLQEEGFENYLVDIGGESRAHGKKPDGISWRIGINVPDEQAALDAIITALPLDNRSVATSGNYRNWYEVDGVKYSHTINPATGFPERSELLSASVFHADCIIADAYATACMVMGVEKALSLIESSPDLEVYLIFSRPDGSMETRYTSGLNDLFEE